MKKRDRAASFSVREPSALARRQHPVGHLLRTPKGMRMSSLKKCVLSPPAWCQIMLRRTTNEVLAFHTRCP